MPTASAQQPAVTFTVNDEPQTVLHRLSPEGVPSDVSATTSLADYLRLHQHKPGTKTMCREGGCGACVVSVRVPDPATGQPVTRAVNSCLVPLHVCQDWEVKTVEGIGDRRVGYHPLQIRLAHLNGTQCGYCSPGMVMSMYRCVYSHRGVVMSMYRCVYFHPSVVMSMYRCVYCSLGVVMSIYRYVYSSLGGVMSMYRCVYCNLGVVMSMYSLLNSKDKVTKADVEQVLDGNLCRCTGYMPILEAFKTFGEDADDKMKAMVKDIEDAVACKPSGGACGGGGGGGGSRCAGCPRALPMAAGEAQWSLPDSMAKLYAALAAVPAGRSLRLVTGNTGSGVYKRDGPFDAYVSVLKVPELHKITKSSSSVSFGSAVTLSRLIEELQSLSETAGFRHCGQMASHLLVVANTPVRNMGSWAGNLMIKYHHREFPSDVFLLLTTARAKLVVADASGASMEMNVEKLYEIGMDRKVILSMTLPAIDDNKYTFMSYKITPRAVSAHAYVNAAFLLPLDKSSMVITEKPTVLFGGINKTFVHAAATEAYLTGKSLSEPTTVKGALAALQAEVKPDEDPELADVEVPGRVAGPELGLSHGVILHVLGDKVPAHLRSGGQELMRPLVIGSEKYDTDKDLWPVSKPVLKLEAQAQTAGEAEYVGDQQPLAGEVHGAFVLSKVAKARLKTVDGSAALALDGVRGFYTAKDVDGPNQYKGEKNLEELFVTDKIQYCGQAIGLVVADTFEIARKAAALVKVEYSDVERPVLTIKDALKQDPDAVKPDTMMQLELKTGGDAEEAIAAAPRQVSGEFQIGGQYHFYMETQTVRVVPCEDDQLTVYCSTQDQRDVHQTVARTVKVPANKVNTEVRRLGGAYGGKLSYSTPVAASAALAAVKLNRPVRIVLDIETNMEMFGGRLPYLIQYKAGVEESGKIQGLTMRYICDSGFASSATTGFSAVALSQNVYHPTNWDVAPGHVNTNLAPNTWCRAPGTTQGIAGIEHVMNRIAHELKMDPWELRKVNFFTPETKFPMSASSEWDHTVFKLMVDEMFSEADIEARKAAVSKFNRENRWRKRALSLLPMRYPVHLWAKYPALVSIYDADGTVVVSVGGIEMGQGLNTKVAQVCAYELGVPLDMVAVKPSNNLVSPNPSPTGGSIGSEMTCMAVHEACQELRARLKPFQGEDKAWVRVVSDASSAQVNLTAHSMSRRKSQTYSVFGLTAAELELDVLTGESCVRRLDLYEDAGQALSPLIDIGQAEGAFVMGMGLFLTERHRFDVETGRRLTNRTWNYYVPTLKDIPRDFRVKLLKNNKNEIGIFNSKATGEPPLCMTSVCLFALQEAVASARRDAGHTDWFDFDAPGTVERAQMACASTPDMFVIA
ncbi:LOW QUALITY PROTEIN: indole-3-acetaldehyde oxidase-like [Pollicipes pollicipes]|uniref:LOW QUALITY PROTEIN: indole-3-acetaldehyde oxidase-like n=1 Tax=Pollicipes pollicipes TaxID=41117 RepID=UPI001884B42C|nr:LOW QUALITY PROTEIN: indole-3-acetaldehyde oxidase-like [Pollicipes pollicipes]